MTEVTEQELYFEEHEFDAKTVLGSKWSASWGDKRNLLISRINLSDVVLVSPLRRSESVICGRNRHARLMARGSILLGPEVFYELREHPEKIPDSWKESVDGQPSIITFDGGYVYGPPKLLSLKSRPTRYVLYLMFMNRGGSGGWSWSVRAIDLSFSRNYRAATLPWDYGR